MALLDTFYLMFKTNADEAKRGMADAEGAAGQFDDKIGRTDEHVHEAGARIVETFGEVGLAIAAAFSVERIREFLTEIIEVNGRLQDTSERIGVAVEDLAALQQGAKYFGGSADGVVSSLDFMNKGLADLAVKGTSRLKPFFDELKVEPLTAAGKVKPLLQVYGELADKMHEMTAQERSGIAERFGIDQGLLLMMAEGRRGFDDLIARQKELGVVSTADAEIADKFGKKMSDVGVVLRHVATGFLSPLLPALTSVFDTLINFVTFLQNHTGLVEGFFVGVGGVIAAVYLPAVIRAIVTTALWLAEILLVPALIAAAFAAFAFAYDDVKQFLAGNNSVIGELSKKWPIVGQVVRAMAKDAAAAWEWLVGYFKGGVNLFASIINLIVAVVDRVAAAVGGKLAGSMKLFADAFPLYAKMIRGIGEALEWVVGIAIKAATFLAKIGLGFLKDLPKAMQNWAADINRVAVNVNGPKLALQGVGGGKDPKATDKPSRTASGPKQADDGKRSHAGIRPPLAAEGKHARATGNLPLAAEGKRGRIDTGPVLAIQGVRDAGKAVHIAAATPLGAHTSNSISNHSSSVTKKTDVKIDKIEVHTQATDAVGIGAAIGGHLNEQIRQAVNHHDDGVKS